MSFKPQVEPAHYQGLRYSTKERFACYWQQIHEVSSTAPSSVLEVGIGNGFVHRFLRELGLSVHTCDADPRLAPETVAVLPALPFADAEFDVVSCFETLEHLPFESFAPALAELRRVAGRYVLLSLPDVTPYGRLHVKWGKRTLIHRFFDLSQRKPPRHVFDGEHYWEIGKRDFPLERITSAIEAQGLHVEGVARLEEDPYHRFFRCRVAADGSGPRPP